MKLLVTGDTLKGVFEQVREVGSVSGVHNAGIVIEIETLDEYAAGRAAADLESELRANYDTSISVERMISE